MKNLTLVSSPICKKIIKIKSFNKKFIKCVFNFVAFLMFLNNFQQAQAQIEAPRPDFRRSEWVETLIDGTPIWRNDSGEDWWYGHCNAYKGNEFIGYMCVGFSRPIGDFPPGLPGDCADPSEIKPPENSLDPKDKCLGTSFSAISLIDKGGDYKRMFKMLNYSYEDLYNVIQTSDGNFVAVGYVLGTRDVLGQPMIYNPRLGEANIYFPNSFMCNKDSKDHEISEFHSYVIKFNLAGEILWQHIYGSYSPTDNSQEELQKAYYSNSQAFDLIEVNSNRIRVVGHDIEDYVETDKYIKKPYILDIDQDGNILNKTYIPNSRYQENALSGSILGICKVPNTSNLDKFAISGVNYYQTENIQLNPPYNYGDCYNFKKYIYPNGGYEQVVGTGQSFADLLTFDGNNYTFDWQNPFIFYGFNERRLSISHDIKTIFNGDLIVSTVLYTNGCGYANPNEGTGRIHRLSQSGNVLNVATLGTLAALDLKIGLTPLQDGGYAAVSTRHSPGEVAFEDEEINPTNFCFSEGTQYYDENTNTDAFFAKFNSQNNLVWETSFNVDDSAPVESTADNPKQQECMYSITQNPEDGSLVAVGNNSYNMDDDYIVKLKSDCSLFETYDIDVTEISPYEINTNEIWNSSKKIRGPVIVKKGVTLYIDGQSTVIEFADFRVRNDGTRLEVEAGANLIITNAKLTSLQNCPNSSWQGIIVSGITSEKQTNLGNGYYNQGYCRLKLATIENAEEAIRLWNPRTWESGGIVRASKSNFINNARSIEFTSYHNFNSNGDEMNNLSWFEMCRFENNKLWGNAHYPIHMVSMWDVYGIRFTGCEFLNNLNPATTDATKYSQGIFSLDAGYFVDKFCSQIGPNGECLGIQFDSKFERLRQGIWAMNVRSPYSVSVNRTIFDGNKEGIRLDAVNNAFITQNKFLQGKYNDVEDIGIRTIYSSKYIIENNFFSSNDKSKKFKIGTLINESGPDANQIYRNTFRNLSIANYAIGQNRQYQYGNSSSLTGLKYLCNDMDNTLADNSPTDILVIKDPYGIQEDQGISRIQGVGITNPFNSAANLFTPDCELIGATNISNLTDIGIRYYYSQLIREEPICNINVTTFLTNSSDCLDRFPRIEKERMQMSSLQAKANSYEESKEFAEGYALALKQSIDNGNTPDLQNNIIYTPSSYAEALAQELNNKTPYLSEDVLKKLVERNDLLTLTQLYNILLQNPEGINTESFIDMLRNRPEALPEWMISNIKLNAETEITVRGIQEKIAEYHTDAAQHNAKEFTHHYLYDTTGINKIQLATWQEKEKDFMVRLQQAQDKQANNSDTQEAEILASLEQEFQLDKSLNLQNHKQTYTDFKNVIAPVYDSQRNYAQLTREEQNNLKTIAENGRIGGQWAENILRYFYKYNPPEKIYTQLAAKKAQTNGEIKNIIKPNSFIIQPNPASVQFTILLPNNLNELVSVEIYDTKGSKLFQQSFKNTTNIDCSNWVKNIYFIRIISASGNIIGTEKLLVQ